MVVIPLRRQPGQRTSADSFRDLNIRRIQRGLPPVEPVRRDVPAPIPFINPQRRRTAS